MLMCTIFIHTRERLLYLPFTIMKVTKSKFFSNLNTSWHYAQSYQDISQIVLIANEESQTI